MDNQKIWKEAQKWERQLWGNCTNTFSEEQKQYIYAHYMGLDEYKTNWYGRIGWDFGNKVIADIGGGPCSMLLKAKASQRIVIDPCNYPRWVISRYSDNHILFYDGKAEVAVIFGVDICLIYNCLQHTENPSQVIKNALEFSKEVRIFEWIDTGVSDGHLHDLTEEKLNDWLKGKGKVEYINQPPCVGKAYYGIFKGDSK